MVFKDVIGQDSLKEKLRGLVSGNRLSHAFLFLGKEGSGSMRMALAFSQYLLCEKVAGIVNGAKMPALFGEEEVANPVLPIDSCGTCNSCLKASKYVHPDIHYTFPVIQIKENTPPISADWIQEWRLFIEEMPYGNVSDWLQYINAENKQGNITSREISEILHNHSLKSHEGEYKIQLIWMAEYLDKEGNKLLKLIEEPPAKTIIILVAENIEKILPTIISRTQLIKIELPDDETLAAEIAQRKNIAPEAAMDIARMSEGNIREALLYTDDTENNWNEVLRNWLNIAFKYSQKPLMKWVNTTAGYGRDRQKQFLSYALHVLEQGLKYKTIPGYKTGNEGETELAEKLSAMFEIHQFEEIIKEISNASYYIERNANAKLLFHALTVKLHYIIKKNSLFLVN